jgi:hypothetical protein
MNVEVKEMTHEIYDGTILAIDCQHAPQDGNHGRSRIKIAYGKPQEENPRCGYELVSFALPESYVGRYVTIINSNSRRDDSTHRTQELIFNEGLERILISNS